jgi:hypothetical protein
MQKYPPGSVPSTVDASPPPGKSKRPVFVVALRAEPHVADPIKALRALLKTALRRFKLRCVSVEEKQP